MALINALSSHTALRRVVHRPSTTICAGGFLRVDYLTGYLGAYGTLLALARRAVDGGSYKVNVSLCQSGMFLHRQERLDYTGLNLGISTEEANALQMESDTTYAT